MFSLANGRSLNVKRGAQPGRKPRLGKPPASGARQSVPLVADGLLLAQAAGLRDDPRPSGQRRSGLARGKLAQPPRLAGPHGSLLLASALEGASKQSEAPRSPGPPKRVDAHRSAARG